tara:strand:+ start:184 stop:432 length:249 start_codon:yes stop_codon:yes gene_type:complete
MKQHEIKNPEPRNLSQVLKDCHDLVHELKTKLKNKSDEVIKLKKDIDILQTDNDLKEYELNLLKSKLKATYVEKLNDRPNQE